MIEARELTKRYGDTTAVHSLSFTIAPGTVTGFLGPNGAGKSTTMRMIMGLDRPTSGTVTVNGKPYRQHRALLREVGALLEASAVHPGRSARSHLRSMAATHNIKASRVSEVIEMTGLAGVATKRVGGFSLGMGQRLGIAAALLGDPRTLILDEPVNGLDPEGVQWVRQLVRALAAEGRTVFLSSHLMSEMSQTADHLLVIGRGRIIADGPVQQVIDSVAGGAVWVRSPRAGELAAALAADGATIVTEESQVAQFDNRLIEAIMGEYESTDFTHSGHDLVGVDFVFSGNEHYTLSCRGYTKRSLDDQDLDLAALRSYVEDEGVDQGSIFDIRIQVENEGQRTYSKPLKEALDFIVDGENVMLSQGRWVRFNEDYIDQLNSYIDSISVEPVEPELEQISVTETDFNISEQVIGLGYTSADKDFSKVKTTASTPIEAWDLQKDDTVYAVKFGTAQKVGYVCDQAMAVLEILRNNANVRRLNKNWKVYCLWFGFNVVNLPAKVSDVNSIILKQKIEAWARRCRELGVEPRVKLSRKT